MASLGEDFVQSIEKVTELSDRLLADTRRCHIAIVQLNEMTAGGLPFDRDETEFWLRTFLRVFFAQVEGLSFAMREESVFLARQGHVKLSEGELVVLSEKRYRSSAGKIESADSFNTTLENIILAFHYFPRSFGAEYSLAKGDARWDSFKQSLTLRNRLMHPKRFQDLDLTAESIIEFSVAFKWFTEQVTGCFGAILEHLDKMAKPST